MQHHNWHTILDGTFSRDIYSTSWVAMVPTAEDIAVPQWPAALDYVRQHQLPDGGWGAGDVYYAHDRTIATMAAILALSQAGRGAEDAPRIQGGLHALNCYADDLVNEAHEPIGFELLLPHLRDLLKPTYGDWLPLEQWRRVDAASEEKLALLTSLEPDPDDPQSWWVNMEMLDEAQLARLGPEFLTEDGALAASTAATAAYLRAKRLNHSDSPAAANYLDKLMMRGQGGVPFAWPAEVFESVWGLDSLLRADMRLTAHEVAPVVRAIDEAWHTEPLGLSFSAGLPVNDGDDTLLGYHVLRRAGYNPSEAVLESFWQGEHFCAYTNERGQSNSVNVHALEALQSTAHSGAKAEATVSWLLAQRNPDGLFEDKWHISPYYTAAHAVTAFSQAAPEQAEKSVRTLLDHQRRDGGWGWLGRSTLEETAHVVLGLYQANQRDILHTGSALRHAARYFIQHRGERPIEKLWIGKTLYRPDGIVFATVYAAQHALSKLGLINTPLVREKVA